MIRILVADDHAVVRQGVKQILAEVEDMTVVAEAQYGSEVMQKIAEQEFDVVLLDISMPGRSGLEVLAQVACTRHEVEEYFENAKSYLGMAQYETRSWIGWHHHMSLVAMAHLFITLTRRDLKKKTPELTLDRTVRLLQRAMEVPGLSLELALLLVDYHIRRNAIAQRSHTKTWMARHERVKVLRL